MPPTDTPALLHARALTKRFGAFTAVDGIDFEVAPGESFGFLGPNGAGKTSTMRMIACTSPVTSGELRVSTEIQMHLSVYRARPDVKAVVHAHPPKSTGFAVAGVPLNKAVLAEVVVTLGCIPLAEYGTPSTRELADSVDRLVRTSDGILLSNHGALTVGKDIYDAYYKMEVIEHFAEISLISRQLGGERLLPRQEVSRLLDLRQRVYQLQGPPGGDACPVPAESDADREEIRLTRGELVNLIAEAIREVDR